MRLFFILILLALFTGNGYSQNSRDSFSFQGVARNAAGQVASNAEISVRLGIHSLFNPITYSELHKVTTSPQGIFNLFVGGGQVLLGNFADINWQSSYYFLQVEIDPNGGNNFTNLGSTQLVSVPYAIHARQADRWKQNDPIVQTGDSNIGG